MRLVLRKLSKISGKIVMKLTVHTGGYHKKRGSFWRETTAFILGILTTLLLRALRGASLASLASCLNLLELVIFTSLNIARYCALDDRTNNIRGLSSVLHPLFNEVFFDRDSCWVVEGVVCANNLEEATVTLSLLVGGYDTVNGGLMLPKTSETKNNCHSNSLQRFQEN
jgi:hypothetical protein